MKNKNKGLLSDVIFDIQKTNDEIEHMADAADGDNGTFARRPAPSNGIATICSSSCDSSAFSAT